MISHTDYSKLVLGLLIIVLVSVFPQGVLGAWSKLPLGRARGKTVMSILAVDNLEKSYSGFLAVKDVSFSLQAGEMLALIGPNGAGKSTCFNMINGQLAPTAGRIRIFGRDVTGLAPREIWRLGVGRTFQIAATFGSMTVAENVQVALLSHQHILGGLPVGGALLPARGERASCPCRHGRVRRRAVAAS